VTDVATPMPGELLLLLPPSYLHAEHEIFLVLLLLAFASRCNNGLDLFQPSLNGWAESKPKKKIEREGC